ncbi:nanos homolog 2-like [Uranotaenia lowii]|uniref:nanos homolog 2-like n=1 Tax=Uranotaenia lowii TaxID=190385 RepID=UPI0024786DDC|nr:nanos homolog 2-like [Uranotaenia lowii]
MSVSKETMELMTAAIKSGVSTDGTLVRSKLTNRLVWRNREVDENDICFPYLSMIGGIGDGSLAMVNPEPVPVPEKRRSILGALQINEIPELVESAAKNDGGNVGFPKRSKPILLTTAGRRNRQDKENWQDDWEILKKSGYFCSFCKSNKEVREIYLSHNLKGPNGDVTCPILLECVCQCCGQQGHTISYCPGNKTGTSIFKLMSRHNNRI